MASTAPDIAPVAIIGAGISGIILGLALHERQIPFQIYEQSSNFSRYGAGLNMNPAGARAVRASSAAALKAYQRVVIPHHPTRDDFYMAYTDGQRTFEVLAEGEMGGIKRSRWIEELAKELPMEYVQFQKHLVDLQMVEGGGARLCFEDGTSVDADVVVGCDGIKSTIRHHIVGAHPSAEPSFTNIIIYRSLLSNDDAQRLIAPGLADCAHVRAGDGLGYVFYPITGGSHNNFGLFRAFEGDWPHYPKLNVSVSKQQLVSEIEDPTYKEFANSLANEVDIWAVHDMAESPLPTFSKSCLALVGDAAHASSPNLGSGASISIEDATVLAELLVEVYRVRTSSGDSSQIQRNLSQALAVYSDARMGRTRWVVESSRHLGMANVRQPVWNGTWDWEKYRKDTEDMYRVVWDGDIGEMIRLAKDDYHHRLERTAPTS